MLEKPDIEDTRIIACLHDAYGLHIEQLTFLPLGADVNTAVYRAINPDASYFVKLRSGAFDDVSLIVPKLLHDQRARFIIAPLPARSQKLWAALDDFKVAVFPFVEGRSGYEFALLDSHWVDFGQALRMLHTTQFPPAVRDRIPQEQYSDQWRTMVREFQRMAEGTGFVDGVAAELAAFMRSKKAVIGQLVRRAEALASVLQAQDNPFVVCHADIHAGNILIDADNRLYLVDWDTLILAPKERDLMFAGGGLFLDHRAPEEEERLFYAGYGQTQVNDTALAYYRYERIVQDIAEFGQQLLLTAAGGEDRQNSLGYFLGQFNPGSVIDMAYRSENTPPGSFRRSS